MNKVIIKENCINADYKKLDNNTKIVVGFLGDSE